MCDFPPRPLAAAPRAPTEYVLDTPFLRGFIAEVRAAIDAAASPAAACDAIEPLFTELIADQHWLPETFQRDAPESGMGGGIGQWLLFRAADRSLCLFSLVVPPGSMTPVHDHLAWGLIGLYRGNQDEEFYRPPRNGTRAREAAPARAGRPTQLVPPTRRHPPRQDDLGGDLRLDPPARERHRLRAPPHLRRDDGPGEAVPGRIRQRRVRRAGCFRVGFALWPPP